MRSRILASLCWLAFVLFTVATVCNEGDGRFYPATEDGDRFWDDPAFATPDDAWEDWRGDVEQRAPACDPDGRAPCPNIWFECWPEWEGATFCTTESPLTPDSGAWECAVVNDEIQCHGDHLPEHDGSWSCEETGDGVTCSAEPFVPTGSGEEGWDCTYQDEFWYCEQGVPGSDFGSDCACVPGARRYCDTPSYCSWGIQTCRDDGRGWGRCAEVTSVPPECEGENRFIYTESSQRCCMNAGYCCQDYYDFDDDGDWLDSIGNCHDAIVCE